MPFVVLFRPREGPWTASKPAVPLSELFVRTPSGAGDRLVLATRLRKRVRSSVLARYASSA